MLLLYFLTLLFKHISVILGNISGGGGRHNIVKEKAKTFLFCLYIVDLDTIMGFFG